MLEIGPVIDEADRAVRRVEHDLPGHPGLLRTARRVAESAREAQRVALRLRRLTNFHRLPAAFLIVVVAILVGWLWWHFVHVTTLRVAISRTDAVALGRQLHHRVQFEPIRTAGSRENLALLRAGKVDVAFVQGGIPIDAGLECVELPTNELLLFLVRDTIGDRSRVRTILTSGEGQGSHTLARDLARLWPLGRVRFVHDWSRLVSDPGYRVAPEVDAVLVVKDPLAPDVRRAARRLLGEGFRFETPDLGVAGTAFRHLVPFTLTAGGLDASAHVPPESVSTYLVKTYLVAQPSLSPRQRAATLRLADPGHAAVESSGAFSSIDSASNLLQGVDAFLAILVYVGLAFIFLAGLDVALYRRRFHELNSLISLLSMNQASKDVIACEPAKRAHLIAYLSVCGDLAGLIAVITGYYAQENSSLLYNKLLEIIPQRCDGLRLNVQLKILHATVPYEVANEARADG